MRKRASLLSREPTESIVKAELKRRNNVSGSNTSLEEEEEEESDDDSMRQLFCVALNESEVKLWHSKRPVAQAV